MKRIIQAFGFCLTPLILLGQGPTKEERPIPVQESSAMASKIPQIDPAYYRYLLGQPPPRVQESIAYPDGSGTRWILNTLLAGETRVRWNGLVRTIPPPGPGRLFVSYGQGALWCPVGDDAGGLSIELLRFDLDLPADGWKKVCKFEEDGSIPVLVVPLKKENRFLGISSSQGFQEPGTEKGSFAGVFRKKEGRLVLESCVELPFDDIPNILKGEFFKVPLAETKTDVAFEGHEKKPDRFWAGFAEPSILTPSLTLPSLSDDFLVLGAASAGVLWILDLENGSVRRTINLTGLNRKDLSKLKPLKHVILGTGFAPDGTLIIASKPSDLIKLTAALELDKPDSPEKDLRKKDFEFLRNEIKDISWWRIDPKNGHQERLDSPVDFPVRMPTAARHTVFRFLVDPYGHVKTNAFTPWSKVMEAFLNTFPDKAADAPSKKGESLVQVDKNVKPQKTALPQ